MKCTWGLSGCLVVLQGVWNSATLQTEDLLIAMQAAMNKETPVFSKL